MADYKGKRAGNYTVLQKLGDGGFATVYLAQHTVLEKKAAVKFLLEEWVAEPDVVARFFDEARTMERLKDHPSIIKIIDIADHEKCESEGLPPYFIMDFIDGPSLETKIKSDEGFTLEFVIEVMKGALSALGHCHSLGVVHRDIKPSNILLSSDGKVILTDFGIAKAKLNTSKTGNGLTLGSTDYMSPEQALGKRDLDYRTDIYSIGVTLYEMVTGQLPFEGDNPNSVALMHIQQEPKQPIEVNEAVPPRLNDLIMKAMAKNREDRFQSCDEMIQAIGKTFDPEDPVEVEAKDIDLKDFKHELPEDDIREDADISISSTRTTRITKIDLPSVSRSSVLVIRGLLIFAAFTGLFFLLFLGYNHFNQGTLNIVTDPPGAAIIIGENAVGTSPINLTLAPGLYKISFSLPEHGFAAIRTDLKAGQTVNIQKSMKKVDPAPKGIFRGQLETYAKAKTAKGKQLAEKLEEAFSSISDTLEEYLDRDEVHLDFLAFCKKEKLLDRADSFYSARIKSPDSPLICHIMHGKVKFEKGDMKTALDSYTKAWYADSNDILLLNYLGEYFIRDKKPEMAKQYLELSIFLVPDQPEIEKLLKGL